MLAEFQQHIAHNFPELRENRFLLACSGGVDSMVLVALCRRSGLDFALAHCNFQLRGEASKGDEDFVRDMGKKYDIAFYVNGFDTIGYANEHKVSVQMAARELRYAWFRKIMKQNAIAILVTAHHADDGLETFLINLSRGTGIEGLTGISAKNNSVRRPLLAFSRAEIEAYARSENITWREDASNAETKYLRNKIRHAIVPLLKELHPTFLQNFEATQDYLRGFSKIVAGHAAEWKQAHFEYREDLVSIPIAELKKLDPLKPYLHLLFKAYGFHRVYEDIAVLLTGLSGKEVRSTTHRLVRSRDHLLLEPLKNQVTTTYEIEAGDTKMDTPLHLKIEEVTTMGETGKNVLYADKETLKYPLTVRKWKNGDYFYPLGMQGKKKLSKYFKDEKIDIIAKDKQWLLCSEDKIVWVIGKRADNRFRITESTKNIVKITLN